MKIDILCRDGSPLGVTEKSLFGEDGRLGVGGAEQALLTLCHGWQQVGYDVTLYNDPFEPDASIFGQKPVASFNPQEDRDILIIFRSPNHAAIGAKGKKVWLSCDQFTVDDFKWFSTQVDKIVTISRTHANYFKDFYGITGTETIDLPVRTADYKTPIEKVSKRCIFTSVPDRGLMQLRQIWPMVISEVPDASLVITSDWRLWDKNLGDMTSTYRLAFAPFQNVTYLAAVKRQQLIEEQMKADLFTYSSTYQELFCIACAEAQVAGAYPITSDCGALSSTNMGMVLSGNYSDSSVLEYFAKKVVEQLQSPKLHENQQRIRELAIKRFSIRNVLDQWDEKVFC